MAKDAELKEEKKKKRKSEVADVADDVEDDKAAKKAKKEKRKSLAADESGDKKGEFDVPPEAIAPIAVPLADKKLSKKLFKTVKRASKARQLKRGVKEVVKALRKGEKGLLLLASNITPIDVISHLPVLAEETKGIEYCWVLSKEELGAASGTKRATSCVLVCSAPAKKGKDAKAPSAEEIAEWKEGLDECLTEVKALETAPAY
ncbi:H/ACA ribonucleoprotein complex subunit nhp2 [Vanrija pseudolonga]|uniref:H/ACA ribonucleoprotein complex subunit 2 n=1 Tax=Vanrija pseudolonga TaxID=143232 RepID=A0AAF0Y3N3_9TREE|nr:H/ACA ribonucleoprotein complex subunit nhp2 [Vanrija pseudolonga]